LADRNRWGGAFGALKVGESLCAFRYVPKLHLTFFAICSNNVGSWQEGERGRLGAIRQRGHLAAGVGVPHDDGAIEATCSDETTVQRVGNAAGAVSNATLDVELNVRVASAQRATRQQRQNIEHQCSHTHLIGVIASRRSGPGVCFVASCSDYRVCAVAPWVLSTQVRIMTLPRELRKMECYEGVLPVVDASCRMS